MVKYKNGKNQIMVHYTSIIYNPFIYERLLQTIKHLDYINLKAFFLSMRRKD